MEFKLQLGMEDERLAAPNAEAMRLGFSPSSGV
jgi:hypothetical protein